MAIKTSQVVAYDLVEHFYYLTELGVAEYTGYDPTYWNNPELTFKKMGRELHGMYTDSFHNNKKKYRKHKELIEFNIFKDEDGQRQAIIDALVMMIELDHDNDWFVLLLQDEKTWTKAIKNKLKRVNVLVYGEMSGQVPEDEYEVGY